MGKTLANMLLSVWGRERQEERRGAGKEEGGEQKEVGEKGDRRRE